jgi:hypothetical protein
MKRLRLVTALVPLLFLASTAPIAEASFHLWKVQEVFSNADGSVQFIELVNNSPGEHFVANLHLRRSRSRPNAIRGGLGKKAV